MLDKLIGSALGGRNNALMGAALGMLGGGGISGLVSKFAGAGLGAKADSWVGGGDNEEISAAEVRQALGDEEIARVAQESGCSEDEACEQLAQALPEMVNEATPAGQVDDAASGDLLGQMKNTLGL